MPNLLRFSTIIVALIIIVSIALKPTLTPSGVQPFLYLIYAVSFVWFISLSFSIAKILDHLTPDHGKNNPNSD